MAKRIKYKIGDVFLVPLNEELYGAGRVLRKDHDTVLIELYKMMPVKSVEEYDYVKVSKEKPLVMGWCYDDAIKKGEWQIIDNREVPDKLDMPYFWSYDSGYMKYYVRKGSEESCIARGERYEIKKEDILKYHSNGIESEISEKWRYLRCLKEAGIIDLCEAEEQPQNTESSCCGILDEDVAADVEAAFMELLEEGIKGEKATKEILEEFSEELKDEEDRNVVYLALVELQLRENCLQEDIREKALEIIESGADLERWEEAEEKYYESRKAALDDLKERLINSR